MEHTPKRVLLAEDDRFMRKAAAAMLRRHGLAVLVAGDGEEALRLARTEAPDVVLLDLIMPKRQGLEVLRALKEDPATAGIPVIVQSTLGQVSDIERAKALGAVDYLVKSNVSLENLLQRVQAALGGHAS